jgi:bifunctional NMN adenylyltransferase/nudix hydrolase
MSEQKFDYVVVIGRFQPYHLGHQHLIQSAKSYANKGVIVLIGSAFQARNIKNPFTYQERADMILRDEAGRPFITVKPIRDYRYNDMQWILEVQETVNSVVRTSEESWTDYPPTVAIAGVDKDSTTDYLNWFPQWKTVDVNQLGEGARFDATMIRNNLFNGNHINFVKGVLPDSTFNFVKQFITTETGKALREEFVFIQTYKRSWEAAPYAPTFVTTDAVVFQDGHVLLIKRGANPGKGLYALPGGFLNQNERILDGVIRELREETKLKVPDPVLRGSIIGQNVFDHPDRSLRGRTITHAVGFKLASTGKLPIVKGGDDAARAVWVSLADIDTTKMYEDHSDIINYFKGIL